ncbi:hypothetical protein ACHHYP_13687 [Achlya hypogyna]|uniref:WRKY19-like zinc finger domain-containing protein n=1 Tax=Achlya hypogyna TaxID=1202772 RepID=A0A1V9YES7_ACHHY|nr:hypothetical protein ACHHYP_13687 [Achlya hypogyna]
MDENSFVKSFFAEDIRRSPLELPTFATPRGGDFNAEAADFFAECPLMEDLKSDLFEPLDPMLSTPVLQKADLALFQFPSSPAFEVRGPQLAYYHDMYGAPPPPIYPTSAMMHPPMYLQQPLHKPPPPVLPIARSQSHQLKPPPAALTKIPVQRSATVPTTTRELSDAAGFKSKGKRCTITGCTRRAQSNNRCKAHGGGARCQFQGCPKSSQGGGFCRAHGGGKKCEFEGCTKGQQRKGFCYAHGGIRKCKQPTCDKKDRGNGYCIAHGGGKRCSVAGCVNAVRKGRFCRVHMIEDD